MVADGPRTGTRTTQRHAGDEHRPQQGRRRTQNHSRKLQRQRDKNTSPRLHAKTCAGKCPSRSRRAKTVAIGGSSPCRRIDDHVPASRRPKPRRERATGSPKTDRPVRVRGDGPRHATRNRCPMGVDDVVSADPAADEESDAGTTTRIASDAAETTTEDSSSLRAVGVMLPLQWVRRSLVHIEVTEGNRLGSMPGTVPHPLEKPRRNPRRHSIRRSMKTGSRHSAASRRNAVAARKSRTVRSRVCRSVIPRTPVRRQHSAGKMVLLDSGRCCGWPTLVVRHGDGLDWPLPPASTKPLQCLKVRWPESVATASLIPPQHGVVRPVK